MSFCEQLAAQNDGQDLVLREFIFNSESYAAKYEEIRLYS